MQSSNLLGQEVSLYLSDNPNLDSEQAEISFVCFSRAGRARRSSVFVAESLSQTKQSESTLRKENEGVLEKGCRNPALEMAGIVLK